MSQEQFIEFAHKAAESSLDGAAIYDEMCKHFIVETAFPNLYRTAVEYAASCQNEEAEDRLEEMVFYWIPELLQGKGLSWKDICK